VSRTKRAATALAGLPSGASLVYHALLAVPSPRELKFSRLQARCGVSGRTVQRALEHLERHGWITRTKLAGGKVRHDLHIGEPCECRPVGAPAGPARVCERDGCTAPLWSQRLDARYCSDRCRKAVHRRHRDLAPVQRPPLLLLEPPADLVVEQPPPMPAGELLAAGWCSPQCLLAGEPGGVCVCRCRGEYHGALTDVEVCPVAGRAEAAQ